MSEQEESKALVVDDWELAGLDAPEDTPSGIDWAAMEPEYRSGLRSLRDLGKEFGCTEAAIRRHAKRYFWSRDLNERIQRRAADMVRKEELRAARAREGKSTEQLATDDELVEVGAVAVARTLIGHRRIIQRHAAIACSLLDELEITTGNKELFEQLGEMLRSEDEKGVDKLNDVYNKVIAMPGRVKAFKELTESLRILIGLERQSIGLSDNGNGDADKPPAVEGTVVNNDAARRIAFVLAQASRKTD